MPSRIYNSSHGETEDPGYKNIQEVYNKTATEEKDWQPMREEIKAWYVRSGIKNFRSKKSQNAENKYIIELGRKYEYNDPPLFGGLDEDGKISTLSTVIRRVGYNIRRQEDNKSMPEKAGVEEQGPPLDETSVEYSSTMEDSTPVSPVAKRQTNQKIVRSTDARDINLKATYSGRTARLLLTDLVEPKDVSSDLRTVLSQVTMDRFIRYYSEDLDLEPSQAVLWFQYEGAPTATKLSRDRQLRGAISDVFQGTSTDPTFVITTRWQNFDQQPSVQPTTPSETSGPKDEVDGSSQLPRGAKRRQRVKTATDYGTQGEYSMSPTRKRSKATTPYIPYFSQSSGHKNIGFRGEDLDDMVLDTTEQVDNGWNVYEDQNWGLDNPTPTEYGIPYPTQTRSFAFRSSRTPFRATAHTGASEEAKVDAQPKPASEEAKVDAP